MALRSRSGSARMNPGMTIRFLAQCGANVNARTKAGTPVLFLARERPENRAALLKLGAKDEP